MRRWQGRWLVLGTALLLACGQASPDPSDGDQSAGGSASATASGGPSERATETALGSPTSTAKSPPVEPSVDPSEEPGTTSPAAAGPVRWTRLLADGGPPAREDHTWTTDAEASMAYLFGGRDQGTIFADLWVYDVAGEAWRELEPAGDRPAGRFGHTATWVEGTGLVVWSGQAGDTFFDDLWVYDPGAGSWRRLPAGGDVPPARYGSCAAIGPDGRLWVSHGFTGEAGRFSDTRAFDFAAGRWTDESPDRERPVDRCLHDCLWSTDGRLLLYAGQTTGVTALGDLWMFLPGGGETPNAWTELPNAAPPPRQLYALGDVSAGAVVFGGTGLDSAPLDDLWLLSFADLTFRELATDGELPDARSGASLVTVDETRLLLFGGRDRERAFGDLWALALDG